MNYPLPISAKRVGAAVCSVALVSALSLPPVALAQDASSSDAAAQSGISLQSSRCMIAYDQALIDEVGLQQQSRSCLGYAAAYAQTITSGSIHRWWEYDYNGGANGEGGFYGRNMTDDFDCRVIDDEDTVLRALYDAVNEGKPAIVFVTTASGSQHWVTVVGYENVDDPDNLSPDNFLMLDPDMTSTTEPESLTARGVTLRYGDWMGNVRISRDAAPVDDGRIAYEHFSDCYYGDWYVDSGAIDYVYSHGLIKGAGGGTYDPAGTLTRGQVATILYRIAGEPAADETAPEFSDVTDPGAYYYNAVRWARGAHVVNGVGDTNTFSPESPVTREQLSIMIANYAREVAALDTASDVSGLGSAFVDASAIHDWSAESVAWCAEKGIVTGQVRDDGAYANPEAEATRAEMAKITMVFHRDVLGLG